MTNMKMMIALAVLICLLSKAQAFCRMPFHVLQHKSAVVGTSRNMLVPLYGTSRFDLPLSAVSSADLQDVMQLLEDLGQRTGGSSPKSRSTGISSSPAVGNKQLLPMEVQESEQQFDLMLEMPGVKKEDVSVVVRGDLLSIQAERSWREERKKMSRSFTLPENVDASQIQAELLDGVLMLVVPKKAPVVAAEIKVEVK